MIRINRHDEEIVIRPRLWYCNEFLRTPRAEQDFAQIEFSCWKRTERNGGFEYEFAVYSLSDVVVPAREEKEINN